jgi:hypothetical protein
MIPITDIHADRRLRDLIDSCEAAFDVLADADDGNPSFRLTSNEAGAIADALADAAQYLGELREARHANQIATAFKKLRDNVARRAARIRRQSQNERQCNNE